MDSATIAQQLQNYDTHKVDSTSALNDALAQYGVPEIRTNVANLRTTLANTNNALNAVDPSVTGRTQGSLVTEAQRQRQVANERAPIAQQLDSQNQAYNTANSDLTDKLNQATTLANNKVNDYNTGRAALASQYDIAYKREQDAAAAEAARQQSAIQQQQFNASLNASSAKSSGGSAADNKLAAQKLITTNLASASGKDGFVSRASFGSALNDWQAIGGTTRTFWQQYGRYVNPATKSQYPGYAQR